MNTNNNNPSDPKQNRMLVAYFTHSGNTRLVAEQIQAMTGSNTDIFEIEPVKKYPIQYNDCTAQAKKECSTGFKPELATEVEDIGKYDVIFIGTPNWWSTIAPPVLSFLSVCDLSGKTVIPFITHGGGGMARCENDIRKACPNSKFGKSGCFKGTGTKQPGPVIENWLAEAM